MAMRTIPAFKGLMNRTVTVKRATVARTEHNAPQLDDLTEITGSPVTGRIEDTSSIAPDDPFWGRYPMASYRLWWAVGTEIKADES